LVVGGSREVLSSVDGAGSRVAWASEVEVDPRKTELQSLTSVGLGLLAFGFLIPVLYGLVTSLLYLVMFAIMSFAAATSTADSISADDWFGLAFPAVFLFVRLAGTLVAIGAAVVVGRAFLRSLNGDLEPAPRAAMVGVAAAILGVVGSVLTFDCLGLVTAIVPAITSPIAAWAAIRVARDARDAAPSTG
jgi:hypothetical protein